MNTTTPGKTTSQKFVSHTLPSIVIILPIEKGSTDKHNFDVITKMAEKEIAGKFSKENAVLVINRLKDALSHINVDTAKKSVVVYVSPMYEKMVYLDFHLDEKIFIDEPFEIRDLIHSLYPPSKYILLAESAKSFRLFIGDQNHLVRLKTNISDDIAAYKNDIAEKIEYFTDTTDRKEVLLDKFIHHIDKELDRVLNKYDLPVFILGSERMSGHFKKYTHHKKSILDYIHGNYDDATEYQLLNAIKPYLEEMKKIEVKETVFQIEQAQNKNRFCFGIEDVWHQAFQRTGQLLIVENDFHYPDKENKLAQGMNSKTEGQDTSFLQDGVDVIIEKVLENGGKVRFADADVMKNYEHIALCMYY